MRGPTHCIALHTSTPASFHTRAAGGFVSLYKMLASCGRYLTSRKSASIDLYVVRGHTRRRRIRNESEVIALMAKLGFEIFDPSGHSVCEQARKFANARKIIGFHGAGLTNTIFCGMQTRFIEICDRGYAPDYYSNIASQLGLEYRRIVHDTRSKHRLAGIAEDISVDIDTLEAQLKCAI